MNIPESIRVELEEKLGYQPGTLAPNSEFLKTFMFTIKAEGSQIDTSTPYGELQYNFCKYHYLVVEGAERPKGDTVAILKNEEAEAEVKNKANQRRLDALQVYRNMSTEDMIKCLRVLGIKSSSMSINLVQTKLQDYIEASQSNVETFFEKWVNNKDKEYEWLIEQAVQANVLTKKKTTYTYGTDVIGTTKEDAIAYLKDKNNLDLLTAIRDGINIKSNL